MPTLVLDKKFVHRSSTLPPSCACSGAAQEEAYSPFPLPRDLAMVYNPYMAVFVVWYALSRSLCFAYSSHDISALFEKFRHFGQSVLPFEVHELSFIAPIWLRCLDLGRGDACCSSSHCVTFDLGGVRTQRLLTAVYVWALF